MRNIRIIFGVVLIAIILLDLFVFAPIVSRFGDQYSGRSVFATESDYTKFKNAIVSSNADWNIPKGRMEILNSTSPIIAVFYVTVPRNTEFPYGTKDDDRFLGYFSIVFLSIIVVGATWGIIASLDFIDDAKWLWSNRIG